MSQSSHSSHSSIVGLAKSSSIEPDKGINRYPWNLGMVLRRIGFVHGDIKYSHVVVLLEHMVGFGVQEFPVVVCPAIL